MDRAAATLSGGEAQRIRLATQIGSALVGVLYVLDEPSIGLHQRDNAKLVATLERLRDLGNTVLVVEHDEQTMRAADHLVDLGPGAGEHGGGSSRRAPRARSSGCPSRCRQVVLVRVRGSRRAARRAPLRRDLDPARAGEELAGQRLGHPLDFARGALGDDPAAVLAGAGPQVDEVVGGAHRLLVVLDHEHRVAEVAQPLECRDELRVVALVQPDRGLVEHVEHADQRRPICVASRIRWASPPDSVAAARSIERYPIPTFSRKRSRSAISRRISRATCVSVSREPDFREPLERPAGR